MQTSWVTYAFIMIVMVLQTLFNALFIRSFNEHVVRLQLDYAANAASDAATEYLLWESQETPYGNIFIDPESVWYIYKYTFLEGVGLNSRANMELLDDYFPTVIIAVNDGYFMKMATQEEVPQFGYDIVDGVFTQTATSTLIANQWDYRFTQKLPFARRPNLPTYTSGNVPELGVDFLLPYNDNIFGNSGFNWQSDTVASLNRFKTIDGENPVIPADTPEFPVYISDTMNGRNLIAYFPALTNFNNISDPAMTAESSPYGTKNGRYIRFAVDGNKTASVVGSAHDNSAIAREVLKAIDYSMSWNASMTSVYRKGGALRIPDEVVTQFTSENVSFVGPMVIAIADQFNWLGNYSMSFWTISNTQIVEAQRIYVYQRFVDGVATKLYSGCNPDSDAPGEPGHNNRLVSRGWYSSVLPLGGTKIEQIFSTQEDAAIYGAYPDVEISDITCR